MHIVDAVMASITSIIHLPRSRWAVLQRTSACFSVDGSFSSCSKGAFVLVRFPYTSPYTYAFVRILMHLSTYVYIAVYIRVYYISYIQCICMTEAPRVLHFSAFIHDGIYDETENKRSLRQLSPLVTSVRSSV